MKISGGASGERASASRSAKDRTRDTTLVMNVDELRNNNQFVHRYAAIDEAVGVTASHEEY